MKKICPECNITYKTSLRANICDDCNKDEVLELQMTLLNKKNQQKDSVPGPDIWADSNKTLNVMFPDEISRKEEIHVESKLMGKHKVNYPKMPIIVEQEKDLQFLKNMEQL
jgi:hypothetical protein